MVYPHYVHASDAPNQLKSVLIGHTEQSGGQSVRKSAVGGDDADRSKMLGRVQGVGVDNVMVLLARHCKEPLIHSRRDAGGVPQRQNGRVLHIGVLGVFDGCVKAAAVGLVSHQTDVAAYVEHVAADASSLQILRRHFGGIA